MVISTSNGIEVAENSSKTSLWLDPNNFSASKFDRLLSNIKRENPQTYYFPSFKSVADLGILSNDSKNTLESLRLRDLILPEDKILDTAMDMNELTTLHTLAYYLKAYNSIRITKRILLRALHSPSSIYKKNIVNNFFTPNKDYSLKGIPCFVSRAHTNGFSNFQLPITIKTKDM